MPKGVYLRTKIVWNKGLTKETDRRLVSPPEKNRKISLALTGRKLSDEHRRKISESIKDKWIGGNTYTLDTRKMIGDKIKALWDDPVYREKEMQAIRSKEHYEKMSAIHHKYWDNLTSNERALISEKLSNSVKEQHKNISPEKLEIKKKRCSQASRKYWSSLTLEEKKNFVDGTLHSREAREKAKTSMKAYWNALPSDDKEARVRAITGGTDEEKRIKKEHYSQAGRKVWASRTSERNRDIINKTLHSEKARKKALLSIHKSPNNPENELDKLLQLEFANEWKYVGDGQLIIGGKCPDFANINGRKDLIDLFGEYWHKPEEVESRKKYFKNYGYNLLIVWVNELKERQTLVDKIRDFANPVTDTRVIKWNSSIYNP